MSVLRRVDTWMFAPAPAERLAVLRILTGLVVVGYLIVRYPAFLSLTDASPSRFEPVGVLSWLDRPFPDPLYAVLIVANVGCGVAFVTGLWFRWIGPIFAVLLLVVTTYRSSWGQLLYFENLMVIHVAIIGLGRSADALRLASAARCCCDGADVCPRGYRQTPRRWLGVDDRRHAAKSRRVLCGTDRTAGRQLLATRQTSR